MKVGNKINVELNLIIDVLMIIYILLVYLVVNYWCIFKILVYIWFVLEIIVKKIFFGFFNW